MKNADSSLSQGRHTLISTILLLTATLILTWLLDISQIESPTWFTINTIWQAHATIIGLSFVVLVFLLEIVSKSRLIEGVLEQFLRKSWVIPVLFYSLLGNLAIAALTLYPDLRAEWISTNLPPAILALSILSILYVYRKVVLLVLKDETKGEAYRILKDRISKKIQEDIRIYEYDIILDNELPEGAVTEKILYPQYPSRKDPITAEDLGLNGVVIDIHIPTFVYGVKEIIRIGEKHNDNDQEKDPNPVTDTENQEKEKQVKVRVKIGDNLQNFSSILHIDSNFFHEKMEAIYPVLTASILTKNGTGREQNIRTIYKYTDFLDQEGKRIVKNSQTRQFLRFLDQYEDVVRHSFKELEGARFLIEEHRYTTADLPFYDLDQILFRVFEAAIEEINREFATQIIELVAELTHVAAQRELYGAFNRYVNLYSRFYYAIIMRDDLLSEKFAIDLQDTLLEHLGGSIRIGIEEDLDKFENLDNFNFRIKSYTAVSFEQAHKIFKYAFENQDPRGFHTLWRELNVPRNMGNNNDVRETLQRELHDLRFNAAAMTYDVSKEQEKYQKTFKTIYKRCILGDYHNVPDLFEIYSRIKDKKPYRTRWGKWGRQEHDIIKQMHGANYALDPDYDLGEFYCFTAIMNGHYDTHREDNPLQGNTISKKEFKKLELIVSELKRKRPFKNLRSHIDDEEFRDRADKFIECHSSIVEKEE